MDFDKPTSNWGCTTLYIYIYTYHVPLVSQLFASLDINQRNLRAFLSTLLPSWRFAFPPGWFLVQRDTPEWWHNHLYNGYIPFWYINYDQQ